MVCWSSRTLLLSMVATLLVGGCTPRRGTGRSPGPPMDEHPGEFRAVVTARPSADSDPVVIVLEARGPHIAQLDGEGWTLESLGTTAAGVEWYGMSAGDLDGDGGDELVIWGFRPQLVSLVLTWDGDSLARVAGPVPELLRVTPRDGAAVLYGQRAGTDGPFSGPVFRLELDGDTVQRREAMGALVDILDFFRGPSEDGETLYAWDEDGTLERRQTGVAVWRDDSVRMTRPLTRERERENLLGESRTELDAYPTIPHVCDFDADGVDDVLVVTSDQPKLQLLERVRTFRGAQYTLLQPAGRGLAPVAESLLLGRFATGITAIDLDGDGDLEALITLVLQRSSGVGRGRSALAAFDALTGDLLPIGRPAED